MLRSYQRSVYQIIPIDKVKELSLTTTIYAFNICKKNHYKNENSGFHIKKYEIKKAYNGSKGKIVYGIE
jgi:hypothetical protein